MAITLTVANESNRDFTYHGQDRYFLSQDKTIESANENMYKFLCKEYDYFEHETNVCNADLSDFLHTQFAKESCDDENWSDLFPEFTFIDNNESGITEISQEMFDEIIKTFQK